jgi:hypothetical protein
MNMDATNSAEAPPNTSHLTRPEGRIGYDIAGGGVRVTRELGGEARDRALAGARRTATDRAFSGGTMRVRNLRAVMAAAGVAALHGGIALASADEVGAAVQGCGVQ